MASLTPDDTDSVAAALTEEEVTTALQTDGVDYARLNELLLFITKRLTTDVHGNFFIKGSHSAKDGRHTQLREVFELKNLLEAVKALMERKSSVPAGDAVVEGKRASKFTSAQLAAIRSLVQQEQQSCSTNPAAQNLALKARMDATEARLKKSEEENVALTKKVQDLEARQGRVTQAHGADVREDIQALEADAEKQAQCLRLLSRGQSDSDQRTSEIEWQVESMRDHIDGGEARAIASASSERMDAHVVATDQSVGDVKRTLMNMHEQIQEQISGLTQETEVLSERLYQGAARDKDGIAQANEWLANLAGDSNANNRGDSKLLRRIATSHQDLKNRAIALKDRILEIEEWRKQHSADHADFVGKDGLESRVNSYARREANKVSTRLGQLRQSLDWTDQRVERIAGVCDSILAWTDEGTKWHNEVVVPGLQ